MRITWDGAETFLAYLDGSATAWEVLDHPAYRAVLTHARLAYGRTLTEADLTAGLSGLDSPFFGLGGARERTPRIRDFIATGRRLDSAWLADIEEGLGEFLDAAQLKGLVVYPIVGYDAGIGLDEKACLNINLPLYLDEPHQFPYMAAHELSHAVYSRGRPLPELATLTAPGQWHELFCRLTQDEGFAVYASLKMRAGRGHTGNPNGSHPILFDYQVVANPALLRRHIEAWQLLRRRFAGGELATRDEYLDAVAGRDRLTYRVGCAIVRLIADRGGRAALKEAYDMAPHDFVETYQALLTEEE